ncbi:MAG: LamG domain-containing protein, partial [Candidatus Micrarchaeota archaeon]
MKILVFLILMFGMLVSAPVVGNVSLTSTSSINATVGNLTVNYQTNDSTKNITSWYLDNIPFAVLNMPFEGGSTSGVVGTNGSTKDYSGYRNDGIVANATWNATGGYDGKGAYMLNGTTDYVAVSNASLFAFDVDDPFSVSIWMYPTSTISSVNPLFSKYPLGNYIGYSIEGVATNRIRTIFRVDASNIIDAYTPTNSITPSAWNFVTMTYTGNTKTSGISVYINGINQTLGSLTNTYTAGSMLVTESARIGFRNSAYFNGIIDDVMVWNRTLTSQEVLALYESKTDIMVSQELTVGDTWKACVTPNNGTADGVEVCSNSMLIRPDVSVGNVSLTSTSSINSTAGNLTVNYQTNNSVKNITDWRVNELSFAVLNMLFEGGSTSGVPGTDGATKDYSRNGNNGTVVNATWNSTGGYDGRGAYSFDGVDDYINLGNPGSLNITGAITYSAWVYVKSTDASYKKMIMGRGRTSGIAAQTSVYLGFENHATIAQPEFVICDGTTKNTVYFASGMTYNAWHHIVGTWDGFAGANNLKVYIDGQLNNTVTSTINSINLAPSTENFFKIARGTNAVTNENFNGSIDDIRIFNRSLSAAEILALYQNKTDIMVSQELTVGDTWQACVTPNNGTADGVEVCSNNVTLVSPMPILTVESPINNTNYSVDLVSLDFTALDSGSGIDKCWYSLDGGANTTLVGCANTTITPGEARHNILFYVNDTSNYVNISSNLTFTVDLTAPSLTVESPINNSNYSVDSVALDFTAIERLT